MEPDVSVILPVRDGGAFLGEAVDSILRQTFPALELLLVDDHSEDNAWQALAGRDPRLRLLRNPGRGVSDAFNHGLSCARGAFIARMDADDIALDERLERQLAFLEAHPRVGIAGACVEFFPAAAVQGGNRRYEHWLNSLRTPEAIRHALFIESPIPNPTAVFRRAVIERLGGYRDCAWPEDYDLYLRADAAGVAMGKPDGVLLRWREHPGRLTRRDSRYSLDQFRRAKAHYLARGRLPDRELVLWGAGDAGKRLYDLLAEEGVRVQGFIDVHPRRIGASKRGRPVSGPEAVPDLDAFILVAVGARGARGEIRDFLNAHGRVEGRDFLFAA